VIRLDPVAESRLYKTAHYNYRNTTELSPNLGDGRDQAAAI
jgi:hypothetical protein